MKKVISILVVLTVQFTWAGGFNINPAGPSEAEVYAKISELRPIIKRVSPVNTIVMSACETESGKDFSTYTQAELAKKSFVYCVAITSTLKEGEEDMVELISRFSVGTGILVKVSRSDIKYE
ncbi:MAG: hypothetical protein H7328_06660 [Bdellovibrio sp.]|nr:hypothetical protein [Bdellovibrio sp.]